MLQEKFITHHRLFLSELISHNHYPLNSIGHFVEQLALSHFGHLSELFLLPPITTSFTAIYQSPIVFQSSHIHPSIHRYKISLELLCLSALSGTSFHSPSWYSKGEKWLKLFLIHFHQYYSSHTLTHTFSGWSRWKRNKAVTDEGACVRNAARVRIRVMWYSERVEGNKDVWFEKLKKKLKFKSQLLLLVCDAHWWGLRMCKFSKFVCHSLPSLYMHSQQKE
jgi:hypothetical protein